MSKYETLQKAPNSLRALLAVADKEDLGVLTAYITDSGKGRLALDGDICKKLSACRNFLLFTEADRRLIEKEILLFGGNSIANVYRGLINNTMFGYLVGGMLPDVNQTTDYKGIVTDVAKHAGATFGANDNVIEVENAIVLKIFKQAFDKMTEAERQELLKELGITNISMLKTGTTALTAAAAGLATRAAIMASLNITTIVATTVSTQMLGKAAFVAPGLIGGRALAAFAGPVGIAVSALWTLADLSSPAYRITLPCVVQLAFMRQKYLTDCSVIKCQKCNEHNYIGSKFCGSCGTPLQAK